MFQNHGHWSLINQCSEFWLSKMILKVHRSFMSCFGVFCRVWRFLTCFQHFDIYLDMVTGIWYSHVPNFASLSWFWRCKEHLCPLSPDFGLWSGLKVPNWVLGSWSWFGYGHWSLIQLSSKFWLFILVLKLQRTSMSLKSWFVDLMGTGGSCFRFSILIFLLIRSLVFDTPNFQSLALYLNFDDAKNIHFLEVLIWGFCGGWRFLTGI